MSSPTTAHSHVRFDEDNLEFNKQFQGNPKIEEPKTPFIRYDVERDQLLNKEGIPTLKLEEAVSSPHLPKPQMQPKELVDEVVDDWSESDEQSDKEANEEDEEFVDHRKQHYKNEGEALRKARELLEKDEDE
eukprot:NODE_71_length_24927_cov_1.205937.p20 type:complete len:132 gc:universal NODE_71_length_24927_cov_1.205937:8412-8017(-)